MSVKFEWGSEKPTYPPAEQVVDAFKYDLVHMQDTPGLCPLVVSAYLSQDPLQSIVEGVGYSKENERLITFHYSLHTPWTHWWDYYENPVRPKL